MTDEQTGEVSQTAVEPATDIPESGSTMEAVDQQQPEEQSTEAETVKNEASEPPKDNAAWAKMRVENKQLKEALDSVDPEYLNRLRGATTPQEYSPQQVQPISEDADYTEVTGRVNWSQQQIARQEQRIAALQAQIERDQDRQAEDAYPELKSDKDFQQLVAEKKLAARMLGRDVTTLELAREAKRILDRRDEQTTVKATAATKQEMLEKQAATAEAKGQTSGGQSALADESLKQRVRRGDMDAQAEVAKNLVADLEF